MKPLTTLKCLRQFLVAGIFVIGFYPGYSQTTETFTTGSFIVNMGGSNSNLKPQGLKPYGMIYDLLRNNKVPVKWIINQTKLKDGVDFTYNGVTYRGSAFIIQKEYINAAITAKISSWISQGVQGVYTTSSLTLPVYKTIVSYPKWTLDAQNGKIAEGFLLNAGINNTSFPAAYNWKSPASLGCCDDFFVMPHADPTWATHGNLWQWNQTCKGTIWAGCHAVSVLENMFNPSIPAQKTNFLSTNGLVLFGSHSGGSIPYIHRLPGDPVAQYLGVTDLAMQNGSEQIYIPNTAGGSSWRTTDNIIAYDPTQANVPVLAPDLSNAASVIVWGRGFGNNANGYVMYEAAHSINKGSANDVAAQRAFFNFSFFQIIEKSPILPSTLIGVTTGQYVQHGTPLNLSIGAASSVIPGTTFTYQWTSTCGGTFTPASGLGQNVTWDPPTVASLTTCGISCTVTDNCGRASFTTSAPIYILPPSAPPTANPDAATVTLTCGVGTSVTTNVLANDSDPNGLPLTLTNVTGAVNGTVSFTPSGNVTFIPDANFTGVVLNYTVCNSAVPTAGCASSTLTINTSGGATPTAVNDVITIKEDNVPRINVLANDGAGLTVMGISSNPSNGKVSINTDGTITYLPNADFAGTDNFTYKVVDPANSKTNTATVTVNVTNDACDGNTYMVIPPASGSYSQIPSQDSYMENGGNANRNYGACNQVFVDREAAKPDRAVLKWDLSSIPVGSTVSSASITLTLDANAPGQDMSTDVHRVTNDWTQGVGVCGGTNNTTVNWNNRTGINPTFTGWTTAGGDFNATVENTQTLLHTWNAGQTVTWSVANMVQGWINGTNNNYGAIFKATSETGGNNVYKFASAENATSARRPILNINYITPPVCSSIPSRAPMAMPDTVNTPNGIAINIATAANDYYPVAGAKTYSIVTAPSSGTATINAATGVITYTPTTTFNGVRSMTYRVLDNTSGLADTAYVYVNITNGHIVANDDIPAGALSGTVQIINVKANDTDPENATLDNSYTVNIVTPPLRGTASVNASGDIVYTPNTGFTGKDTLYYSIAEPAPACGSPFIDTAMVAIVVLNRPPVANNDNQIILPCKPVTFSITGNDTDPENGVLTVISISALSNPAAGTLVNNNDGTVTFTPTTGFIGTISFTYAVIDDAVPPATSTTTATVNITVVILPNNPPVAQDDYADTTNMDAVLYESVLDNDSDPDANLLTNPVITINPLHGAASVLANGLIKYIPNPGFFGADTLTYQVCDIINNPLTCSITTGLCATAKMFIYIKVPNTTYAVNDQNSTWINMPVTGGVMINDFDLEGDAILFTGYIDNGGVARNSGTITVSGVDENNTDITNAGTLNINVNGTYTYIPAGNFTGVVTVPYLITDNNSNAAIDSAYLKITVSPLKGIANSVIANNDENITYGNPVSGNVLTNDRDPQGDSYAVSSFRYNTNGYGLMDGTGTLGASVMIGGPTLTNFSVSNAGTFVLNANGAYTFTPATDFHGKIDISYSICDNGLPVSCTTAVLHIEVLPDINGGANDRPFAGDDFVHTSMNIPVNANFVNNDYEPNSNPVSINGTTINTGGAHTQIQTIATLNGGNVVFYADGTYTYNPPFNYMGPDQLSYQLCDVTLVAPQPLCANATLYFLVSNGIVLPLDLLSFTGKRAGKDNFLQWSTAQESNSSHFEIENKTDNTAFTKIGSVTAKGNSSVQADYSFIHRNPAAVVNYYRLKLVDLDGHFKYSKTVALKTDGVGVTLNTVYPNPFKDKIDLAITSEKTEKVSIIIYDAQGRLIQLTGEQLIKGLNLITISGLADISSGTYFLEVKGTKDIIRAKLFKTQ